MAMVTYRASVVPSIWCTVSTKLPTKEPRASFWHLHEVRKAFAQLVQLESPFAQVAQRAACSAKVRGSIKVL